MCPLCHSELINYNNIYYCNICGYIEEYDFNAEKHKEDYIDNEDIVIDYEVLEDKEETNIEAEDIESINLNLQYIIYKNYYQSIYQKENILLQAI